MPKTATKRNSKYVGKTFFGEPEVSSMNMSGGNATRGKTNPRNVIGDTRLNRLKNRGRGIENASTPISTPAEKQKSADKLKATVDREMDEVIEMVRKAKTARRTAY